MALLLRFRDGMTKEHWRAVGEVMLLALMLGFATLMKTEPLISEDKRKGPAPTSHVERAIRPRSEAATTRGVTAPVTSQVEIVVRPER